MQSKNSILLLGPSHPYRGGIAETQNEFAMTLKKLNYKVYVWTFKFQYPNIIFPGKTQLSEDLKPNGLSIERKIHSMNPINWIKLSNEINRIKPKYLFIRYWTPFLAPCWFSIGKRISNKTKIIGLVDNWIPHERRFSDNFLNNLFQKTCNCFITLSSYVSNQIKQCSSKEVLPLFHPINNFLPDTIDEKKAQEKLCLNHDKKYILFAGLIREYKGLDMLIDAFKKISDENQELVLLIAGEFYENKSAYLKQIKNCEIQNKVKIFDHFQTKDKLRDLFCASKVVVQPYKTASQSGITPLAYKYLKPLVSTNIPGLSNQILEDKTGVICEINPSSIADGIKKAIVSKNYQEMKNQISLRRKYYTWEKFCIDTMNFIESINLKP